MEGERLLISHTMPNNESDIYIYFFTVSHSSLIYAKVIVLSLYYHRH